MSDNFKADQEGRMAGHAAAQDVEIDSVNDAYEMLVTLDDPGASAGEFPTAPLSGEWGGESPLELSTRYGVDLTDDDNATSFENAWYAAWRLEVSRRAVQVLEVNNEKYAEKLDLGTSVCDDVWGRGWVFDVDTDDLDMNDLTNCVLGQLVVHVPQDELPFVGFGSVPAPYDLALRYLRHVNVAIDFGRLISEVDHGFMPQCDEEELTIAWKIRIEKLRGERQSIVS